MWKKAGKGLFGKNHSMEPTQRFLFRALQTVTIPLIDHLHYLEVRTLRSRLENVDETFSYLKNCIVEFALLAISLFRRTFYTLSNNYG